MGQIAAGRAVSGPVTVHEQHESVVGTDAHGIARGNFSQREAAAEVEHQRLPQRGRWMGDPRGLPVVVQRVGLWVGLAWAGSLRLCLKGDGGEGECEKG